MTTHTMVCMWEAVKTTVVTLTCFTISGKSRSASTLVRTKYVPTVGIFITGVVTSRTFVTLCGSGERKQLQITLPWLLLSPIKRRKKSPEVHLYYTELRRAKLQWSLEVFKDWLNDFMPLHYSTCNNIHAYCSYNSRCVPSQTKLLLRTYPCLHWHSYDPSLLAHVDSVALHLCVAYKHSSTSVNAIIRTEGVVVTTSELESEYQPSKRQYHAHRAKQG